MLIDTHAHLNIAAFDKDRDEVIKRCFENKISMINIGTNLETSKKAVELVEKYPSDIYASIGLHPINLDTGLLKRKVDKLEGGSFETEFDYQKYKELALQHGSGKAKSKVVAVGEVGLDYYLKPKTTGKKILFKEKQKELLLQEIKLAQELNLPVIFHCRMAHEDLLKILISNFKFQISKLSGVVHGFVGTAEELEKYLEMGFYIGFNGIIFKKIEGIDFVGNIKRTPLEKILIETDCPYLKAPDFPEERNNPLGVKLVAEYIAKIKKISFEDISNITTKNAQTLFRL
ncbi:MAG TPA: TatD family hydrolase [Candidatus Pacearchaeota archaeon]|nr:TatD family hydrolase [Candidatus Pacearchaeota archaeon]HOK94209.1 TatD family hydrolase [Candidatus Pacearchaeota archaeon]HPO75407.1 TatD family hydrolase [Candidatus Pacearchaeota archaeon]